MSMDAVAELLGSRATVLCGRAPGSEPETSCARESV